MTICLVVALAAAAAISQNALASSPGDLDSAFGTEGLAVTAQPDGNDIEATNLVQTANGLVAGGTLTRQEPFDCGGFNCPISINDFELARYGDTGAQAGQLDTTFGNLGLVTTSLGQYVTATMNGMGISLDGKKIFAGGFYSDTKSDDVGIVLAVYRSDGSLVGTFKTPLPGFAGQPGAGDLYVQPSDGKIVVAGTLRPGGDGCVTDRIVVARYLPGGNLDTSFGAGGIKISSLKGDAATVGNGGGGRILVGAAGCTPDENNTVLEVARFDSSGHPDKSFSVDGLAVGPVAADSVIAHGVAMQPGSDGDVVIAGEATAAGECCQVDLELDRFTSDGTPDDQFGTVGDGSVITDLGTNGDEAMALDLQTDGKIVVGGETEPEGGQDTIAVVRYQPDGTLDPEFGTNGTSLADSSQGPIETNAVLVTGSTIVTAGKVDFGGSGGLNGSHFLLARFHAGASGAPHDVVAKVVQIKSDEGFPPTVQYYRNGHWFTAYPDQDIEIHDKLRTGPHTVAALEFVIGGRVGINKGSTIQVASEGSVDELGRPTVKRIIIQRGGMWAKVAKRVAPLEIQTNGGAMGIKG